MPLQPSAATFISLGSILTLLTSLVSQIDIEQFVLNIKKPKGIIIGLLCQFGIVPITAFCMSYIFALDASLSIALVIIGTCPGGALSNVWCFVFNANLPLSIAMTTCSTILSFAFITMNAAIYIPIISRDANINIDWISLTVSVCTVLLGIIIGLIIAYVHNLYVIKYMRILGLITMLIILIWTLFMNESSRVPLKETPALAFVAIVCVNMVALLCSFGISLCLKLKRQSAVSVAIESSNQNAPLAIAIILLSLEDGNKRDLAMNIPVIYMFTNILFVFIFGISLRRSGWLQIDEEDKTMTLGKIIEEWRENRTSSREIESKEQTEVDVETDAESRSASI